MARGGKSLSEVIPRLQCLIKTIPTSEEDRGGERPSCQKNSGAQLLKKDLLEAVDDLSTQKNMTARKDPNSGGHLTPVTLEPVSRIFRFFRIFYFLSLWNLLRPLFSSGERDLPHFSAFFCIFTVSGSNR